MAFLVSDFLPSAALSFSSKPEILTSVSCPRGDERTLGNDKTEGVRGLNEPRSDKSSIVSAVVFAAREAWAGVAIAVAGADTCDAESGALTAADCAVVSNKLLAAVGGADACAFGASTVSFGVAAGTVATAIASLAAAVGVSGIWRAPGFGDVALIMEFL